MEQLAKIIITVVKFSEKSRREGLFSLEDDINELDKKLFNFFKFGMKLVLDGIDNTVINHIFSNMIKREKDKNEIKLITIQTEAVFSIQAGDNTRILCLKLFSHLEKNESRAIEYFVFKDDLDLDDDLENSSLSKFSKKTIKPEPVKIIKYSDFIKETANLVKISYYFAHKAQFEGLLSLEDEIEDLDEEFYKEGLRLVVDGTDSVIINDILSNKINREQDEKRKIIKIIMKEAVLNIQAGNSPEFITHILISFINNSELKEITNILSEQYFFKENVFEDYNTLENDKKKFTEQAANIIQLAYKNIEKSKESGLKALKEDIDHRKKEGRDIFEYGIKFAVEGIAAFDINHILSNLIAQEKNENIKRLKIIQKEAVLGICNKENPAVFLHALLSHIDNEELEEVKKIFSNNYFSNIFNKLLVNPYYNEENIEKMKILYFEELDKSIGSKEVIDFFTRPCDIIKDTDPELLNKLIKNKNPKDFASILAWLSCGDFTSGGIEKTADILKFVEPSVKNYIIKKWQDEDSETADEVMRHLLTFEYILNLEDKTIQKIMREIDSQELAKALKAADEDLQNKIFKNMSKQAAAMLKEDMEYMGPVRLSDAKEAQNKIVEIVKLLDDKGEISILP